MIAGQQGDTVYLSMETYIENACTLLNIEERKKAPRTPISVPIDPETTPLEKWEITEFLTALGMLGWPAQTVRCDISYAYSRMAQHSSAPTVSAWEALMRAFEYLRSKKTLALHAEVYQNDRGVHNIRSHADVPESEWRFFCDSDHLKTQRSKTSADHKTACWLH